MSAPTLSPPSSSAPESVSPARTSFEDAQETLKQTRLDTKLLNSISMADEALVLEALADGADIQAENNKPLTMAIHCGAAHIVQLLLDHGAKMNAPDEEGRIPILLAVKKSNLIVTKILTEHGAYVNASDKDGMTPLHSAATQGDNMLVRYLVQHGAKKDAQSLAKRRTPLHCAALFGKVEVVESLIDAGCDIEAKDYESETALFTACWSPKPGDYQCVKLLLERGAKLEVRRSDKPGPGMRWHDGETVLHVAARFDLGDVVELLLEKGADAYARNRLGETAMDLAVFHGKKKAVAALPGDSRSTRTRRTTNGIGELLLDARLGIGKLLSS